MALFLRRINFISNLNASIASLTALARSALTKSLAPIPMHIHAPVTNYIHCRLLSCPRALFFSSFSRSSLNDLHCVMRQKRARCDGEYLAITQDNCSV